MHLRNGRLTIDTIHCKQSVGYIFYSQIIIKHSTINTIKNRHCNSSNCYFLNKIFVCFNFDKLVFVYTKYLESVKNRWNNSKSTLHTEKHVQILAICIHKISSSKRQICHSQNAVDIVSVCCVLVIGGHRKQKCGKILKKRLWTVCLSPFLYSFVLFLLLAHVFVPSGRINRFRGALVADHLWVPHSFESFPCKSDYCSNTSLHTTISPSGALSTV